MSSLYRENLIKTVIDNSNAKDWGRCGIRMDN